LEVYNHREFVDTAYAPHIPRKYHVEDYLSIRLEFIKIDIGCGYTLAEDCARRTVSHQNRLMVSENPHHMYAARSCTAGFKTTMMNETICASIQEPYVSSSAGSPIRIKFKSIVAGDEYEYEQDAVLSPPRPLFRGQQHT